MKTYKFYIEWNTGDMYWDNIPIVDEFEGTANQFCIWRSNQNV